MTLSMGLKTKNMSGAPTAFSATTDEEWDSDDKGPAQLYYDDNKREVGETQDC